MSSLYSEAFASKFAHNNLDLERATKFNKIDFEINKHSILPYCGVVRSDSGKVVAMCRMMYGKDCLTDEEKEVDLSRKSPPADLLAQRVGLSYLDRWRAWRLEILYSESAFFYRISRCRRLVLFLTSSNTCNFVMILFICPNQIVRLCQNSFRFPGTKLCAEFKPEGAFAHAVS